MLIDVPATGTILVSPDELYYTLPSTDLKRINRLSLQSEIDMGLNRDLPKEYRVYMGNIIFDQAFDVEDVLYVDYYKHLKYFTDITNTIDLEDRFSTLYTSYCTAQYYSLPEVVERLGENPAKRQYDKNLAQYVNIREQISAYYTLNLQPSTFKEVF
jgi:hypothetical protein